MGIGATRVDKRIESALGIGDKCLVQFEPCQSVEYGGVLLLLPFLLANGLLAYQNHYSSRSGGYYNYDQAMLTLAFMLLCRIKSVEQLKHIQPGEFGKLMGIDRCPEAKCLRGMIKELVLQKKAGEWNSSLAGQWINDEQPTIFYTDGHVQVYHGHLANLGKKHVSRQKLCLPGMVEFWVNNGDGLPYFFITGQVNEKLQHIIEEHIIPQLNELVKQNNPTDLLPSDPDTPVYTIAFDREAYSPAFFGRLWDKYRVAVLTYNKNVKDLWEETDFEEIEVDTHMGKTTMILNEKQIEVDGVKMREVRELSKDGHQTSIITTNKVLSLVLIAINMFARWSQENFFRYMRQEYDLDRITQYGIDELDINTKVVNREYSNLTQQLKKTREKIARHKAQLFELIEQNNKTPLEQTAENIKKQLKVKEEKDLLEQDEKNIIEKRKQQPYYITVGQMPENTRYNKLTTQSKHIQNIVKMICYRAETAFVNLIAPHYKRSNDERRALVKSVIFSQADIEPDYNNKTLTVTLYSMASNRDNEAVQKICIHLNDSETEFPGTNLKLVYKSATF